ncbi:GNAT family N-acetyltransferase [Clostridium perfringens]|nr:GNAT family N-acetyltransferase [Clostridium perfringens]
MEVIAYCMEYMGGKVKTDISLVPFREEFFEEYKKIYNECFYEMRKYLYIKPYYFYSSIEQLEDKKEKIFVLKENDELIGSVAMIDGEIDDLIVNPKYQGKGYGKKLLLYAINKIQNLKAEKITLHVAKWNEKALKLYENNGFKCVEIEKVR